MSASQLATLNPQTALVDKAGNATRYLAQFMRELTGRIETAAFAAAGQIVQVPNDLVTGAAAIATAALVVSASAPLYRTHYGLRISQAAGVSSSAQVTLRWTQGGIAQTYVGANVNGNTTTSNDRPGGVLMRPDAGTVITYEVAYASAGAPAMKFELDIVAEDIG